eukprot:8871702-Pyramimonas_sp.AAC.1
MGRRCITAAFGAGLQGARSRALAGWAAAGFPIASGATKRAALQSGVSGSMSSDRMAPTSASREQSRGHARGP